MSFLRWSGLASSQSDDRLHNSGFFFLKIGSVYRKSSERASRATVLTRTKRASLGVSPQSRSPFSAALRTYTQLNTDSFAV